MTDDPTRHRRTRARTSSRRALAPRGRPLPRPPDLPLGLPARRHRLRADDRPRRGAARRSSAPSFAVATPHSSRGERSADGTEKFLLELADGRRIESVFIPDTPGADASASRPRSAARWLRLLPDRQDGARPQPDGRRDRRPGARARRASSACSTRRFNIVLMGMGEPLHNYDETMKALRILADEDGLACRRGASRSRRSASCRRSSGWRTEPLMPNLAISLHATTETQRDLLVPLNRKVPARRRDRRLPAVPAEAARAGSRSST